MLRRDMPGGGVMEGGADGLLGAYVLDGRGGGRQVGWDGVREWRPAQGTLWLHLDRSEPRSEAWLSDESALDALAVGALLAEETRPRCLLLPGGVLIILRGVNLNPGADPEDMVSLRMWVDAARVITLRRRRIVAAQDVQASLDAGAGPTTGGALVAALAERLIERMRPVMHQLDEQLDAIEGEALDGASESLRPRLADLRRQAIALRRHIAPQRDALGGLSMTPTAVLTDADRQTLREIGDRVTRYVEDLDALRERAAVTNDELSTRLAETMNRRMYLLSMVAAVFLPLGLLTGLLGVNVGGIPGTNNEWGFTVVTALLLAIGGGVAWLLRARHLF
jgi:zinc transporter